MDSKTHDAVIDKKRADLQARYKHAVDEEAFAREVANKAIAALRAAERALKQVAQECAEAYPKPIDT